MKRIALFTLVILLLFSSLGCGGLAESLVGALEKATSDADVTPVPTPTPEPTPSPEELAALLKQAQTSKENSYVSFSNLLSGRFGDSVRRYFQYFGTDEKMSKKRPISPYTMHDSHKSTVQNALDYVAKEPAMPEMDASVKELGPVVQEMMDVINQIMSYYDLKNYVDDDFVKGQELHGEMLRLYDELAPKWEAYDAQISEMVERNQAITLNELKEEGYMLQYYALAALGDARSLNTYLYENAYTYQNVHKAKLDEFQPMYESLSTNILSFLELCEDPAAIENEAHFTGGSRLSVSFDFLKDEMGKLKTEASELYDRIKSGKKARDTFSGGIPEDFAEQFSTVIDRYNSAIS